MQNGIKVMKDINTMNQEITQKPHIKPIFSDFFGSLWEESWSYIKTVVDVAREPVLILDKNLSVLAANEFFCDTFKVKPRDAEGKVIYKLGDGQWDILSLRKLLEEILPVNNFVKGFEVTHDFPIIGRKVMILNARKIYIKEDAASGLYPSIILLAIEDVTDMVGVAEMLARHTNQFEAEKKEQTEKLNVRIKELEEEINDLREKSLVKTV